MLLKGFDSIALFYDKLAAIVFGKKLLDAKAKFLPVNTSNQKILIIGGGTGFSLGKIIANNTDAKIYNVDSSDRMQELSRQRVDKLNIENKAEVRYCNLNFDDFHTEEKFDFMIAPFFFDMFNENDIKRILKKIRKLSRESAVLIITDFRLPGSGLNRFKAKVLLWMMYRFFRLTTDLKSSELPNIERCMASCERMDYTLQKGEMVFSAVYKI